MKPAILLSGALCIVGADAFTRPIKAQTAPRDTRPDTWVATDALGRAVPVRGDKVSVSIPAPRAKKMVGMFYFLWLGEHGQRGPFDITKILQQDPDAAQKPDSPLWGPLVPHHWGESAFGHYVSRDEWVLRRHAQMLSDAGVDVVFFDASNQLTYPRAYRALCKVWSQMRREGNKTPQIAFLMPFFGARANAVQTLYSDFYQPGIARDLWFQWQGKPLILADPASITQETLIAPSRQPIALEPGETLGQSFRATRPFNSIGGSFPTWSAKDSGVTLSLFDRAGGKLLARRRFENVVNNATASLEFPTPLPAGDYYFEISQAQGTIGWWTLGSPILPRGSALKNEPKTGSAYLNGQNISGSRTTSLIYQGDEKPTDLEVPPVPTPADREQAALEMRDFFTFRDPQPSYFIGPTAPNMWSWLEVTPQHVFKNSKGENEQMSVGIAQNAIDGKIGVLSNPRANGRSYNNGKEPQTPDFTGRNFNEQWNRVFEIDPQFVFVTGWNEWIAWRKNPIKDGVFAGMGPVSFVDLFNAEFSRDIEPVKGGHGDAYYYQLIANIRRFKGARAPEIASAPKTIRIDGNFSDWKGVSPQFLDDRFDTTPRDEAGWNPATRYVNTTGRNDFEALQMTRDAKSVFAYARTRETITPRAREWMNLLIDTDQNAKTGWMGFDFCLNAAPVRNGSASVEKWSNGAWKIVGAADFRVKGREMEIAVPRALLGLKSGKIALDFKWMDNVSAHSDTLNLYRNGDTAPNARFKYRFSS